MTAAKRTAPISSHPAFKWGVAAWFALLLGLGLFVMPAEVHLLLADRLGLGAVLPGATAIRAVLSAGAALLGLAIGLVLAMRVAALNETRAELDDEPIAAEPEPEAEYAPAGDDVWLPDAGPVDEAPTRRTHPLRVRAARSDETPAPQETQETQESGPQVVDAPRRPFNPREDLAEEGIAPYEPERDSPLFEGEDIDEELAVGFLQASETVPDAAYSTDAWDIPRIDSEPEPEPATAEEEEIVAISFPSQADGDDEGADFEDEYPHAEEFEEEQEQAADVPPLAALGDLSLDALTARLGSALEAAKPAPPTDSADEEDPVIAFLRREAEREAPAVGAGPHSSDPQAELRSALDKLSRVAKPE